MLRLQITLGVILMVLTLATVAWIGVTEETRLEQTEVSQLAFKIQEGAELFGRNCSPCHGEKAQGIPGLCPPLNSVTLLEQRAKETGWAGSVHDYIKHTIEGGRLVSTRPDQYVGQKPSGAMAMPFWGQQYGGPLRDDQIEDITLFLMNYTGGGEEALAAATPTPAAAGGTTDPVALGKQLYQSQGCGGCHTLADAGATGAVGPTHEGLAQTAAERINDPSYTGTAKTPEEYIHESIVNPAAYVVSGYQNIMPPFSSLSGDQVNALVQYLMTVTKK
ncbi:MAG: cytochrome c [Ardenticatenaceae bacterium]|nr:cytochrome c [Ardenticatenaceae bacterium]HBY98568.1 hypothetical protein [Chloroflexota bacterium]